MKKFVYLFELDSVRKTDQEIIKGQQMLYDEIVGNGNVVVLTYNQLVDSRAFFSLLDIDHNNKDVTDEEIEENNGYYKNFITLFENSNIRVSQFGDTRTIAQYLLNSLDYDRSFVFSGWPLKSTQKRLLALIKRSLMYSDLTEIRGYKNGERSKEEIRDLFLEVIQTDDGSTVKTSSMDESEFIKVIDNLYWFLKMVLRLSAIPGIYISPKPDDVYHMSLPKFCRCALKLKTTDNVELWNYAIDIIRELDAFDDNFDDYSPSTSPSDDKSSLDRSKYLNDLRCLYDKRERNGEKPIKLYYQYAEAIVDICYNYQLEYSVCNSSKHYNLSEFLSSNPDDWITFKSDFFARLRQVWDLKYGNYDERFMLDETNKFVEFDRIEKIPDFSEAVRMTQYAKENTSNGQNFVTRYEYQIKSQKKKQKVRILNSILKKIFFSLICLIVACVIELFVQTIQGLFDNGFDIGKFDFNKIKWSVIETLIFLFVTEGITTFISKHVPGLLSLSDAISGIGRLSKDCIHILKRKSDTYINENSYKIESKENFVVASPIDYIESDAIKNYRKQNKHTRLFAQSTVYPIADTSKDSKSIKDLVRLEEIFNFHFGSIYRSKYNALIVDPIIEIEPTKAVKQPYFPYERIIPVSGNGVIMVTKCNDKFIVLEQFRHAPRKLQYAFPRGYGENGILSVDNAKKELKEEIGATDITKLELIGKISPDSGITASCASVYLVEVSGYSSEIREEGIKSIELYSESDIENMIRANATGKSVGFDDGFTIAAYELYREYMR